MRRRYIALFAVLIPIIIVAILRQFYPISYDILLAYVLGLAIVFKTTVISFYSASKLKLLAFIKGLTILQIIILLVKRWFLDNVFTKWLQNNIVDHIIDPFKNMFKYYRSLSFRRKVKNFLVPFLVTTTLVWLIYYSGYLDDIFLFTELKVFIIGLSKGLLAIILKVFGFVLDSWITPILELFAFSFILSKLEDWLGKNNPIVRAINWIGNKLNTLLIFFADLNEKYLDPILNHKVSKKSKEFSEKINNYIDKKKIIYEYEQFERLENKIMAGHIDAYHYFKGMENIKDKKKLYSIINKRTKDYLDIVAYASRTSDGSLVDESVPDSYYHDIFILEGIASSYKDGVAKEKEQEPDATDFWILNTSNHPATLIKSDKWEEQELKPNSLTLIKTSEAVDYKNDKICFKYKDTYECAIVLDD